MAEPGLKATIDFTPSETLASAEGMAPRMAVVEGSQPRLSRETQSLLRSRLRSVTTVLLLAFSLFFLRYPILPTNDRVVILSHLLILLLFGGSFTLLSGRRDLSLRWLRTIELATVGVTIAFFATVQYRLVLARARQEDPTLTLAVVKSSVIYTIAMMSTYGIFIPNTWRRAATIIIPMALTPLAVALFLKLMHPEFVDFARRVATFEQVSDNTLMLLIGAITAIFGTHTINALRAEVFEARQLGQYRLQERIGAGGMGEVYLAEHQLLKRPCAIKLIRPDAATDPRALARFEREVRATARLSHPNTVEIYDYGRTEDGTFFYVMEYLPGLSLDELVRRHGPLPAARVIHLLRQSCEALSEAHEAGLIHRDLKPANIFAARRGGRYDVAKLLDFGLVKPTAEEPSLAVSREESITGSPLFMAPEQATGSHRPDRRVDIYALGAVAYFLLTGHAPFEGHNALIVMIAHARDAVTPPSRLRAGIPDDLEKVVLRCLAKDPDDRYQDAESLEHALASCADAGRWTHARAKAWWRDVEGSPASAIAPPSSLAETTDQIPSASSLP